ncbi:unnamed protein product [Polarella glacialis]|uniref:Uncharacterized protein n=1 Tax=Polarella glacialis TaxID=89957 RepID=A0A813F5E7_POLGL|nr:unnamed protein product [Polarella glacialis]
MKSRKCSYDYDRLRDDEVKFSFAACCYGYRNLIVNGAPQLKAFRYLLSFKRRSVPKSFLDQLRTSSLNHHKVTSYRLKLLGQKDRGRKRSCRHIQQATRHGGEEQWQQLSSKTCTADAKAHEQQ